MEVMESEQRNRMDPDGFIRFTILKRRAITMRLETERLLLMSREYEGGSTEICRDIRYSALVYGRSA